MVEIPNAIPEFRFYTVLREEGCASGVANVEMKSEQELPGLLRCIHTFGIPLATCLEAFGSIYLVLWAHV